MWTAVNYLGPAALLKAFRFEVDSCDEAGKVRLPFWDNERGAHRCHTITDDVEAYSKELNPTEGIQWLKMVAVRRRLFGRSGCRSRGAPRRRAGGSLLAALNRVPAVNRQRP